jgi:hypothetical protein
LEVERGTIVSRHGDVVVTDPYLAERVVVGGLTAIVDTIEDGWKDFGSFGPMTFGLETADLGEMGARCGSSLRGFSIQQR